jgi:FMN phosphatase YigB (HAD superfamily)
MIRYILFDLDNTLYPVSSGMEDALQKRIAGYMSSFLGLSPEGALGERSAGTTRYGTTLEWLIHEKGFTDIDGYYAAVHPVQQTPRYVEGCLALGGAGLLLDERDAHPDFPHPRIRRLRELTAFLNLPEGADTPPPPALSLSSSLKNLPR